MDLSVSEKAVAAVTGLAVGILASYLLGKVFNKCCCEES
jgi:hypothetical protein